MSSAWPKDNGTAKMNLSINQPGIDDGHSENASVGQAKGKRAPNSGSSVNPQYSAGSGVAKFLEDGSSEEDEPEKLGTTLEFYDLLEKDKEGQADLRRQGQELRELEAKMEREGAARDEKIKKLRAGVIKMEDMEPPPRPSQANHLRSASIDGPLSEVLPSKNQADRTSGTPPKFTFEHPVSSGANQRSTSSIMSIGVSAPRPRTQVPENYSQSPWATSSQAGEDKSPNRPIPSPRSPKGKSKGKEAVKMEELADESILKVQSPISTSNSVWAAPGPHSRQMPFDTPSSSSLETPAIPTPSIRPPVIWVCREEVASIRDLLAMSSLLWRMKQDFFDTTNFPPKPEPFEYYWTSFVHQAWDMLNFSSFDCSCERLKALTKDLRTDLWETRGAGCAHFKGETLEGYRDRVRDVLNAVFARVDGVGFVKWNY